MTRRILLKLSRNHRRGGQGFSSVLTYFFLAFTLEFALAINASNRGSLCRDFSSGSDEICPGDTSPFSTAWFRSANAASLRPPSASAQPRLYHASATVPG